MSFFQGPEWVNVKAVDFAVAGVPAKWHLGKGPCGETVRILRVKLTKHDMLIDQRTDDSDKLFIYSRKDITGRITYVL